MCVGMKYIVLISISPTDNINITDVDIITPNSD